MNYPMEPIASKRKDKVLSFEANLSVPAEDSGVSPIQWIGYSRFVVTIVDKKTAAASEKANCLIANIPERDIAGIYHRKNAIITAKTLADMMAPQAGAVSSGSDPVIRFGKNKGKTVSEAAASMTAQECRNQADFYRQNLAKFPANAEYITAFEEQAATKEAANDPNSSEPTQLAPSSFSERSVELYKQDDKYLESKRKGDLVYAYKIKMEYHPKMDYPYEVFIRNAYCPLDVDATGQTKIVWAKATEDRSKNFLLQREEFESIIDKLFFTARDFETSTFNARYRAAQEEVAKNIGRTPYEHNYADGNILRVEGLLKKILDRIK